MLIRFTITLQTKIRSFCQGSSDLKFKPSPKIKKAPRLLDCLFLKVSYFSLELLLSKNQFHLELMDKANMSNYSQQNTSQHHSCCNHEHVRLPSIANEYGMLNRIFISTIS